MDREQARKNIKEIFEASFDEEKFIFFIMNLLNLRKSDIISTSFGFRRGYNIPEMYRSFISSFKRIAKYSIDDNRIDVLIVYLKKETSLEHARSMQRNFITGYLKGNYGSDNLKDAALVAFVSSDKRDWRFSLVKIDYHFKKIGLTRKVKEEFTPARRWSFLVGESEKSHTAQSQLVDMLINDKNTPTLSQLEEAFSIETVTNEFFLEYRNMFIRTKEALEKVVKDNPKVKSDFKAKGVNTVDFSKKLLGQIVFLYFLQKKGWFGVGRDNDWGTGSKKFLRELFEKKHSDYKNFFNDILEPLFYEVLRVGEDRRHLDYYYSRFDCRIPFLNGGLFDPIGNYDWVHIDIHLPNNLFSNNKVTERGDKGDGILDIFDRYNFTIREDEPLEKEVAIDPELLGKAYEKFNAIRPDNFEEYKKVLKNGQRGSENKFNKKFGVYYTPREIVHYMCQQSLINYLFSNLNKGVVFYENLKESNLNIFGNEVRKGQLGITIRHENSPNIPKNDIETLIHLGEQFQVNDEIALSKKEKIDNGFQKSSSIEILLPENIRKNASLIDERLKNITICDPAVGSGAFPVGMMNEIIRTRNVLATYIEDSKDTSYELKRSCIENSLYGVDIDPGAVEISKLRLWLSLIVDEENIKHIKPLPNLNYKIVCGNSLLSYPDRPRGLDKIEKLKHQFFSEIHPEKKDMLRNKIDEAIYSLYENSERSFGYKINFDFKINFSEAFPTNDNKDGFDIVIGNPPYVSTKGRSFIDKNALKKNYGFADDLYSHFYFKGNEITKEFGTLCYISSRTFWTIQTKKNLRELFLKNRIIEIYDTGNPFDAMVETCVIIVQKIPGDPNSLINVLDGKNDLLNPEIYEIKSNIYQNASNHVFFIPNVFNMNVYQKYNTEVKRLMDQWWDKICTSKKIKENYKELEKYRECLKEGNITLLGLITDGGVGLQTADNGKFVGVLENTKLAKNIKKIRPVKLIEAILSNSIIEYNFIKDKSNAINYLNSKDEVEIRDIFDNLKSKCGRDIFGQGYLYKIIFKEEIANVERLTEQEKKNGIDQSKPHYVPYDKGDRDGNRWYLETPFVIDWSKAAVSWLYKNSGKKGQGMPVVRNPQFYFKEGFCWTDVNSTYLKCRVKKNGIHDVLSMSLFSLSNIFPEYYIISLINSKFVSEYVDDFINNTSHFQINDARQLPIIIPSKNQLSDFNYLFDNAVKVKKLQFNNQISKEEAEEKLNSIQELLDEMVYELYGLTDNVKIVEEFAK